MQNSWSLSYLHLSHRLASAETRRILGQTAVCPMLSCLVSLISDYELIRQDKEKVASAVKTHAFQVQ